MKLLTIVLVCCSLNVLSQAPEFVGKFDDAVPVLNVGTFHMSYTPDAHKVDFDEFDKDNQREIKKLAKKLAAFKPTIIVIEDLPENNAMRQREYLQYLDHPDMQFAKPSERELLAYEVGRLSKAAKIYGINFMEGYNYNIYHDLPNKVDSLTYKKYLGLVDINDRNNPESGMPLPVLFRRVNHPMYLDMMMNLNADALTYVSTKGKAEGADEAAKLYHRNLVMFSNLNQIEIAPTDRIFILMGAGHAAFFRDFLSRSPKYKLEDTLKYLD